MTSFYPGSVEAQADPNPAFQGEWVHPEIDNPEYSADDGLYKYSDIGAIGFDLWQVRTN